MIIWQVDFYKSSHSDLWQLLLCDPLGNLVYENLCPQSAANVDWLVTQLRSLGKTPARLQIFRPQSAGLLTLAAEKLAWPVELTRHVRALKSLLQERGISLALDRPPPQALPDHLLGQEWRFARISAGDLSQFWSDRPLPIRSIPDAFHPLALGLASTTPIPGIVLDGGRKSMVLARWIEAHHPVSIAHLPAETDLSGGLILESGLVDRTILATYEDPEVRRAASDYEKRLQTSLGLHFFLIQPDNSGHTFTAFWLLRQEEQSDPGAH
jgi:RNA-binding protein Tab2/Atab2